MMTYKNISKTIFELTGYKLDITLISRMLKGERKPSLKFAIVLADLFPGKDVITWKNASAEQIERALDQLPEPEKETV